MNIEDVVLVATLKDLIYLAFLQIVMLVSVFLCGYYLGSKVSVEEE